MPLFALVFVNFALGISLAFVCATELRSTVRGPWNTTAARALTLHQLLLVFPLGAWWMLRAPDWAVSYWFHAARAPSLLLGILVVLIASVGFAGFAVGAAAVSRHRTSVLPWFAGVAVLCTLAGTIVFRSRFSIVTSYVHFKGGLGPQPGLTVHSPDIFLLGIALWIGGGISLLFAARSRVTPNLSLSGKNSR